MEKAPVCQIGQGIAHGDLAKLLLDSLRGLLDAVVQGAAKSTRFVMVAKRHDDPCMHSPGELTHFIAPVQWQIGQRCRLAHTAQALDSAQQLIDRPPHPGISLPPQAHHDQ